jgi:hypothetical protein
MGSDYPAGHVYDLRRIEDVFACLEIISVARGVLFGVDPELARRMAKVSDALGALAQLVMEGGLGAPAEAAHGGPAEAAESDRTIEQLPPDVFSDMTVHMRKSQPVRQETAPPGREIDGAAGEHHGIVDILTGERIK